MVLLAGLPPATSAFGGLHSGNWVTGAKQMEPPAGAAPARLSYKGSLQAAARRRNGRSPQCCPGRGWRMRPAWALARLRWSPHPELHQARFRTEEAHRW